MYKFQTIFRPNHSTNLCLSHLIDKILIGFDENLLTGIILIDLQKSFDTINGKLLLQKRKAIKFSEQSIQWSSSYRIFLFETKSKRSNLGEISCRVPQGSILGPFSFFICVNDMPQGVKSNLLLYAVESCLMYQHKEISKMEKNKLRLRNYL